MENSTDQISDGAGKRNVITLPPIASNRSTGAPTQAPPAPARALWGAVAERADDLRKTGAGPALDADEIKRDVQRSKEAFAYAPVR